MYYALVTKLQNVRKDENSNNLYLAECFFEGVIVGPNSFTGQEVLYLPTDGKIERWFGDELKLFRKNLDGTPQRVNVDPCSACCDNLYWCRRNNAPEPVCQKHLFKWLQQPAEED